MAGGAGRDGALRRLVIRASGTPAFVRVAPKLVPRLDRAVHKATRGRLVVSTALLPSLVLTATGARSGIKRVTPLATHPEDGSWYVVGSNFGRRHHPAWTVNLIANPGAEVSYQGTTVPVRAHLLTSEERTEVWPRLVKLWPNYELYMERSGRELRIFRLDPQEASSPPSPI